MASSQIHHSLTASQYGWLIDGAHVRVSPISHLLAHSRVCLYEHDGFWSSKAKIGPGEFIFCTIRRPIVILWGKKREKKGPLRSIPKLDRLLCYGEYGR